MSSVVADKVEAVIIIEPMARDGWSPRSRGGVVLSVQVELHYCTIIERFFLCLKALDYFGNCQRLVFSLGVFQHTHA